MKTEAIKGKITGDIYEKMKKPELIEKQVNVSIMYSINRT
jgi:hypothetical protein